MAQSFDPFILGNHMRAHQSYVMISRLSAGESLDVIHRNVRMYALSDADRMSSLYVYPPLTNLVRSKNCGILAFARNETDTMYHKYI